MPISNRSVREVWRCWRSIWAWPEKIGARPLHMGGIQTALRSKYGMTAFPTLRFSGWVSILVLSWTVTVSRLLLAGKGMGWAWGVFHKQMVSHASIWYSMIAAIVRMAKRFPLIIFSNCWNPEVSISSKTWWSTEKAMKDQVAGIQTIEVYSSAGFFQDVLAHKRASIRHRDW